MPVRIKICYECIGMKVTSIRTFNTYTQAVLYYINDKKFNPWHIGCPKLKDIPYKHRTYELCCLFIALDPENLESVPWKHKTVWLCSIAMQLYPPVIKFVPTKYITYDMCKECIVNNPIAIYCIPRQFINKQLWDLAYQLDPTLIKYPLKQRKYRNKCFVQQLFTPI